MDALCHKLTASFVRANHKRDATVPVCSFYEVSVLQIPVQMQGINIQVKSQEAFLTGFKISLKFFLNESCSLHVYEITIELALTILFSCNLIKYRGIAELNTHLKYGI